MTLLRSSQMKPAVAFGHPIRSGILMRQNVAEGPAERGAIGMSALSAVVGRTIGSLGGLVVSGQRGRVIVSFQPLLCSGPANLRSSGLPRAGATAHRQHVLSQLRCSVRALLKVSVRAVLTQSYNSGNNLQLSEKFFRESELRLRKIQTMPGNDARRRIITRPHHFKLAPLG